MNIFGYLNVIYLNFNNKVRSRFLSNYSKKNYIFLMRIQIGQNNQLNQQNLKIFKNGLLIQKMICIY